MRVHAGVARTLDRLDLSVGRELHVRRAEKCSACVPARDGHDHVVHRVLDEGARNDDAHVLVEGVGPGAAVVVLGPRLGLGGPLAKVGVGRAIVDRLGAVLGEERRALRAERGVERIAPADAHVQVALLVEDHDVARVHAVGALGLDLGRGHDVELANLRVAGQELKALVVVRHLERLRGLRTRKGAVRHAPGACGVRRRGVPVHAP